jgi:hypothetical protein
MNLNIAENYRLLAHEVTSNWKTGIVMTGVAVVVGQVYGRIAALFVVLITVSNYQIVAQQIGVISWMSLRKVLIAAVVLGNSYYNIINPHILSNVAIAIVLIDNFQLSSINVDLKSQNEVLRTNEEKLLQAQRNLAKVKQSLLDLNQSVKDAEAAKAANTEKAEALSVTVQTDLVAELENVNTLIDALVKSVDLKELFSQEETLRKSLGSMLTTFAGICEKLPPLVSKIDQFGTHLDTTTSKFAATVQLSTQQIADLREAVEKFEKFKRG